MRQRRTASEVPLSRTVCRLAQTVKRSSLQIEDLAQGEDAIQITTLNLATQVRMQVTRLPRRTNVDPFFPDTGNARFLSDGTIVFYTLTNAEGLNPNEDYRIATVRPDGTDLKLTPPLISTAGTIYPHFVITGDQ